jgi:hypothetical protein
MTHRDAVQANLLEVSATPRGYCDQYGVISPLKADVDHYARTRGYKARHNILALGHFW